MQQIRFFKSVVAELEVLQQEINSWIQSEGIKVIAVTGNIAPQTHLNTASDTFSTSDVLVIVTYEANNG